MGASDRSFIHYIARLSGVGLTSLALLMGSAQAAGAVVPVPAGATGAGADKPAAFAVRVATLVGSVVTLGGTADPAIVTQPLTATVVGSTTVVTFRVSRDRSWGVTLDAGVPAPPEVQAQVRIPLPDAAGRIVITTATIRLRQSAGTAGALPTAGGPVGAPAILAQALRAWEASAPGGASTDFAFLDFNQPGAPAINWPRFDPCTPIEWGIDRASLSTFTPEQQDMFVQLASDVFDELNARSPYRFLQMPVPDGAGAPPWTAWNGSDKPRLVVSAYSAPGDPVQVPGYSFAGRVAEAIGWGGPQTIAGQRGGQYTWITRAMATVRTTIVANIDRSLDDGQLVRAVVAHEVGHALGLGHAADSQQLMWPSQRFGQYSYGAGDLAGLKVIADLGCRPAA